MSDISVLSPPAFTILGVLRRTFWVCGQNVLGLLKGVCLVIYFVFYGIAVGAASFGIFQILRGRSFSILESLRVGLRRLGSVLGLQILLTLLIIFATLLLIVPGVILYCALFFALPACIFEHMSPMASLSRSRALTKGRRGAIFGLILLGAVPCVVMSCGIAFVVAPLAGPIAVTIGQWVANILFNVFSFVLSCVVYYDLRIEKEGLAALEMA